MISESIGKKVFHTLFISQFPCRFNSSDTRLTRLFIFGSKLCSMSSVGSSYHAYTDSLSTTKLTMLLAKPTLVLLDESTSNLEDKNEVTIEKYQVVYTELHGQFNFNTTFNRFASRTDSSRQSDRRLSRRRYRSG
jgi:hypothetical protein